MIHFGLTLCVALLLFYMTPTSKGGSFRPDLIEAQVRHEVWEQLWLTILVSLQLLAFLIVMIFQQLVSHSILPTHPVWLLALFFYVLIFLSVPLWSYCFGWIFIRSKDWLNHFPVLGKKVF
jgi:hypothetical protein